MRKPRILGAREVNHYHVMSRVVNGDFIFGEHEKEFFLHTMKKLASFSGLKVLTYCIMSNHFHLLVEVPTINNIDDEELVKRIQNFYPKRRAEEIVGEIRAASDYAAQTGNDLWLKEFREKYTARMGNLSSFSKELKERFTKWYNRNNARRGTLWEERFKSVLVESSEHSLLTIAAYIDLNPVRAGLVQDPRDYRHCGYAEAVSGNGSARSRLQHLLSMHGEDATWRKVAANYRSYLFCSGTETNERAGFSPQAVQQVIDEKGELSFHELLRCRVRYFSDGVALGSRLFVEEVFADHRELFGERRKTGARKLPGDQWNGLCSLRNLILNPITASG